MISISLNTNSGTPLYLQIYEYIKQEILQGSLSYPERLPSARSLASFLQVSRSTVDTAYEQLLSEGYIESRQRSGYYVCRITHNQHFETTPSSHGPGENSHTSDEWSLSPFCDRYDLNPDAIDTSHFPYSVWKSIGKNQLDNPENFLSGSHFGTAGLRQAIADYLHGSRGVQCSPDCIVVGAGLDHLLQMLCVLFERNVTIAMEDPGYQSAKQILLSGGCQVLDIPLHEKSMDVEKLTHSQASICYVTPSHQFPLGSVMPVSRRQELLAWASSGDHRYIIEDDHDSEFRYIGKPIPSLQSMDQHQKVIYIGTFSKAVSPAIRTGYMVLPPRLMVRYRTLCGSYACPVSRIQQSILAEFIREGAFEKHLNRMRKIYKGKHDAILNELSAYVQQGMFEISGDYAGLYIILRYLGKKDEQMILKNAEKNGIRLRSLRGYYADLPADYLPTFLIGFGNLRENEIHDAVELLVHSVFLS